MLISLPSSDEGAERTERGSDSDNVVWLVNFSATIATHRCQHCLGLLSLETDPSGYERPQGRWRDARGSRECNQSMVGLQQLLGRQPWSPVMALGGRRWRGFAIRGAVAPACSPGRVRAVWWGGDRDSVSCSCICKENNAFS